MSDLGPRRDDALRQLIVDSVDSLEPADRLARIRARTGTAARRRRRRTWLLAPAAIAATLALAAGTTYLLASRDDPPPVASPHAVAQPPGIPWRALPVYYAGSPAQAGGEARLFREFRRGNGSDVVSEAVQAAVGERPQDPDYRTLWPAGTTASARGWDGESLRVVLGPPAGTRLQERPAGMTARAARLAVQQVVYTAQAAHGKGRVPVRLLVDGAEVERVLGVPAAEPLLNDPAAEVVSPVNVTTPEHGFVAGGTKLHVTGRTTEAVGAVVVEIVPASEPDRKPLVARRVAPTAGDGFGTFSATLAVRDLPDGDYTVRAVAARRPYEDSKQFSIRRAR